MLTPVVPYQDRWQDDFQRVARALRDAFGHAATRIDHIGSTAVVGLAAKPIIDVQVAVETLAAVPAVAPRLIAVGFVQCAEIDRDRPPPWEAVAPEEWRKVYFRTGEGSAIRAHVHVREQGRRNYRYALLFRDYLRSSPRARGAYGTLKAKLADAVGHLSEPGGGGPYLDLKDPVVDLLADAAEAWAEKVGWSIAPSTDGSRAKRGTS